MTSKQLLALYRKKLTTYTNYLYNVMIALMDTLDMSTEEFKSYCTRELGMSERAYDELMLNL